VIDTVLERAESVATLRRALGDRMHRLVAVTCSLATLEARERERANRPIGLARRQLDSVLGFTDYAMHVDSDQPLESYVARVAALL
jgi:chloramphenicol 3-O-phosphotransferase